MPDTVWQHEMAEWQLSFQVASLAEATIPHDRWGRCRRSAATTATWTAGSRTWPRGPRWPLAVTH